VQVSSDDVNYAPVATATGAIGIQTLNFSATAAQYVRLYFMLNNKSSYRVAEFEVYSTATSTSKRSGEIVAAAVVPDQFELQQNYPNPFPARGIFDNPSTQIRFGLPQESHVTIKIYAINGAEVRTLVDDRFAAGMHTVTFNAVGLPSGAYFCVMHASGVRHVRRLMLVK
jgi:hypothetical protein